MNRKIWLVAGIVVVALAVLCVFLGLGLVPSKAGAQEKGTVAGWYLVWIVIWVAVVSSVSLGAFLIAAGLGKVPETRDQIS